MWSVRVRRRNLWPGISLIFRRTRWFHLGICKRRWCATEVFSRPTCCRFLSFTVRRYYQTNWQGIAFSDFITTSSVRLADANFYRRFYSELFFKRYANWEQLPLGWRRQKQLRAGFVSQRLNRGRKVLSVGCGLGAVEHYLKELRPDLDICVHEIAPEAWRWLERDFGPEKQFVGFIPGCIPADQKFDMIYLSAVDYALEDADLVPLLASLRAHLAEGGSCFMLSASFLPQPVTLWQRSMAFLRLIKHLWLAALRWAGLRSQCQFWGWMRNAKEYRALMNSAGYRDIRDGLIDSANLTSYWVAGSR